MNSPNGSTKFFMIVKMKKTGEKKSKFYPVVYDKVSESYIVSSKEHGTGDIAQVFDPNGLASYLPYFLNMPNVEKVEIFPDKG
jgi:hypothetical protein